MPTAALDIRGLTMRYAGRTVVDDISLSAHLGQITVVLGPNGAGKTTTIETAEGFRTPHEGSVRVLGRDPRADRAEVAPRVGVMLQSGGVWPALRAADMLAHVARLYANPLATPALLDRLGLAHVARTPYRRLSGGEQQKLALACAVVGRPELLFLDEPTTGLDPESRMSVWAFLTQLRGAGVGIVMSTHLLDEAQALADHVVVIDHGRVAASGSVASLTTDSPALTFRTRPGLPVADLEPRLPEGLAATENAPGHYRVQGEVTPDVVAAVTAWCAEQGALPQELSTTGGTLSDAYFEITARSRPAQGVVVDEPAPRARGKRGRR
ncbi:MAG: ABC transporter ATP-binding protein [Candidatus Nanopelagicales bacterium]